VDLRYNVLINIASFFNKCCIVYRTSIPPIRSIHIRAGLIS